MKEILQSQPFQENLARLADSLGRKPNEVLAEAEEYLKEMYATHNPLVDLLGAQGSQYIVSRGYDKSIDVDAEQVAEIGRYLRTHSVAFVITHKTYLDTFVLGVVLAQHGFNLPYTFGGINMSFAGLGQIGRRAGGIFIRRSFKDNEIYKAVLRHYIAHLVGKKASFMWAIEGTRSRTGKLLWPRLGILKYIAEGAQRNGPDSVKYVPVSISYDLIPDVPHLTQERKGNEKKAESLGWFLSYIRKMGDDFGRISVRFGTPVQITDTPAVPELAQGRQYTRDQILLQKLAFELVYRINQITPINTTSLVCTVLLSRYNAYQSTIEGDIRNLMRVIDSRNPNLIVDRGKSVGQSVKRALQLLDKEGVIERKDEGDDPKWAVSAESYLMGVYYSNMSAHQFVNGAFVELALLHCADKDPDQRQLSFWAEVMRLRDLFKFEFFYATKPIFSDQIEAELRLLTPQWQAYFEGESAETLSLLDEKPLLVAHAILAPYIEAYRVVAHTLQHRDPHTPFDDNDFVRECIALGEELHWQGKIQQVEAVSRPFLLNGIRLVKNANLTAPDKNDEIDTFLAKLDYIAERLQTLQEMALERTKRMPVLVHHPTPPPASVTVHADLAQEILAGPNGSHIGAFFDLDRTLIEGFSAKEFVQERLFSGTMTSKEIVAQFAGILVYAIGNRNFAGLAAVGARGVKGVPESDFIAFGEDVFKKHLASEIFPESRALVEAHLAKGHTVAIISAATPYQVNPVAFELGIEHVACTRMEVVDGHFTGKIVDPPCWGEGKAIAARQLASEYELDLEQSYFYTDSHEDIQLLEVVGKPRPLNPDGELLAIAEARGWPAQTFRSRGRPSLLNVIRTTLAYGTMLPALFAGISTRALTGDAREATNVMASTLGDLGTALAGIHLNVIGEENMWAQRPAVFIFNHQSASDLLIGAKLLRKDATAIAKKELKFSIAGPLLMAGGVVFVDRGNRKKAIESLEPAVEALRNGTSLAIAPEGTRSRTPRLGQFKKGAFHMAMQAGVPIVPMVIKNAHDAQPKGRMTIRPTTIEVVVLKPIPTTDWRREDLDQHIADIRALFLRELGQRELSS